MSDIDIILAQARETVSLLGKLIAALEEKANTAANLIVLSQKEGERCFPLIKKTVAEFYGFKVAELESVRRDEKLSLARHVAFFFMRELTNESMNSIGLEFKGMKGGAKDHGAVLHGIRRVKNLCDVDVKFAAQIALFRQNFNAYFNKSAA